jgi:hypothetical protein
VNFCGTIELSYISTGLLVRSWLLWIQRFPFAISFGACLELVWRFERRAIYIISLRATMSLELDEVVQNVLHSNSCTDSKHAPKTYHKWKVMYAKQPTPNQLPTNSPVQLKITLMRTEENCNKPGA